MTLKREIAFWVMMICLFLKPDAYAIINGTADTTHDSVGTVYIESDQGTAITTGVLVDESWVLTVAHAVEDAEANELLFIVGEDYNTMDAMFYSVDQVVVHPSFAMTDGLPVNNYALLHLSTHVSGVSIMPLMSSSSLYVGTNGLLIGYGVTSSEGDDNTVRRSTTNAISEIGYNTFTLDFQTSGACSGDSGGPVIVTSGGVEYIAGIISYGNCETYTVCGRVSSVYDFITDTIESGTYTNNNPTAPVLVSPLNNATGINPEAVTFSWNPSTDGDGDAVNYWFYLSDDSSFAGCTPEPVTTTKSTPDLKTAGFYIPGIFLCFLLFGLRRKIRRLPVLSMMAFLCLFMANCSDSGNTPTNDEIIPITTLQTDLSPATTYYWKVVADDGKGGFTESAVRSFTTL